VFAAGAKLRRVGPTACAIGAPTVLSSCPSRGAGRSVCSRRRCPGRGRGVGRGGYIQVGMRGCVTLPTFIIVGGKLNLCCYPGSLPRGGEASCLLALFMDGSSTGGGACGVPIDGRCVLLCSAWCLPALSTLRLWWLGWRQWPWGHTVVVCTLAGLVARAQNLDPPLGTTPPGDFRERDGCGWGEIARLRGFHVTNRLIYRRVS
jgi:hypothetical protein